MPEPVLTVIIPTYDRPQYVQQLVGQLLQQRDSRWKLIVLDNHSPTPVRDLVPADVDVVRNPVNIGAAGNFPRAFELATTEWVWLIGDDDIVDPDAIDHVLSKIAEYPDAAILNFGCHGTTDDRNGVSVFHSLDDFLKGSDGLITSLWLTANVYRRQAYWKYMGLAYRFADTNSAHYVLILLILIGGASYIQLPRAVCGQIKENNITGGNHGELIASLMALADLPMTDRQRRLFAKRMSREYLKFSRDVTYYAYHLTEFSDREEMLYLFFSRWTYWGIVRSSPGLFLAAILCRFMLGYGWGRFLLRIPGMIKENVSGVPARRRKPVPRFFRQ
jgi:glycosyltransferase involved in cell wall biosynthesis